MTTGRDEENCARSLTNMPQTIRLSPPICTPTLTTSSSFARHRTTSTGTSWPMMPDLVN